MTWDTNSWPFFLVLVSHVVCIVWAMRGAMQSAERIAKLEHLFAFGEPLEGDGTDAERMQARLNRLRDEMMRAAVELDEINESNESRYLLRVRTEALAMRLRETVLQVSVLHS